MSTSQPIAADSMTTREGGLDWGLIGRKLLSNLGYPAAGIAALVAVWWLGGWLIASNPDTESFADIKLRYNFF